MGDEDLVSRWPLVCSRVLALFAFAFGSRHAHAEPRLFVDLDYRTDATLEGCPSDSAFRAQIQAQLGYDPFRAESSRKVVARAAASSGGIEGFVRWYDASGTPRGERELLSPNRDCAAFARNLSFAIAVQIQLLNEDADKPTAEATEGERAAAERRQLEEKLAESPPAGERPGEPPRSGAPPPVSSSPSASENERPWQLMIGAGPGARFGSSPRAAFEGRIFAAIRSHRFALELGADASLPSRNAVSADGAGFDQSLAAGSLSGCVFVWPFSGCLVNRWARLGVHGFGVDAPNSSSGLVAQVGPRAALNGSFGRRWIGVLRVESLVALSPWRVTLRDQEVWRASALSLSVGFDLIAVFDDNP